MPTDITEKDVAAIWLFLWENPSPTEKDVESAAATAGMSLDKFRRAIYLSLGTFVAGGRANEKELTKEEVDVEQAAMGLAVEQEHVLPNTAASNFIAERISRDHLAELPKSYYTLLAKMEKEGGGEEKASFSKMAKKLIGA